MLNPVLLFFDISAGELIIILLVAFVVFGPSRIPEIARKIGRGLNEVRRASDEIKREITKETRKFENTMAMDDLDLPDTRRPVKKKENSDNPSDQDEKKIIEPEKNDDEGQPLA